MKRLVEWNCKEKGSALPVAVNEFGDTYSMEDICAQLATLYDVIGDCDIDHLRELIQADREGRCFVFMVPPDRNTNKADVVICDDGEAYLQTVYEVDVGRSSTGEMNCVYLTNGGPAFETSDIGKTVFLPRETDKIEAALAKMKEAAHE